MRDGNRATRSAALVAGFGLIAWAQVAAALAVVLLILALLPAAVALRVGAPLCIATAGLLWFATSRALRVRHATPAGVPVTRADAAALWALIDAAAATAQAAPPDTVTVIADARVWVGERSRFLGLVGAPRCLYLGLPLLQAWDVSRLGAAITHELAHTSTVLGRFAPVAYRGRLALARIVRRIPRRSPAGPLLRAYSSLYRRSDASFAWAQELAADRAAAAFAGPQAAAAVLRDAPALLEMQHLFHAEYLSAGWQAGFVPDDVFGGLLRVLAARPDDLAHLRALPPAPPDDGDPHPPLPDRLTALSALSTVPDSPAPGSPAPGPAVPGSAVPGSAVPGSAVPGSAVPGGPVPDGAPGQTPAIVAVVAPDEPAADLIPDLPGLGRALQAVAFPAAGRTVVDWDEFFTVTRNAEMEREADAALRAIGHAVGAPVPGLAEALDLVADGRLRKAAEIVFAGLPPAEAAERITDLITLLLALAALRRGAARWRHSWTGTAELVAIDGSHLDLAEPAALAADPATVDLARCRLADLGIDLSEPADPDPDPARPPARVPVHGGVVNVLADGARTDLLILETGLLLIPSLPRSRNGDARRRLARLASGGINPDGSLAASPRASDFHGDAEPDDQPNDPLGSRLIPYADVTRAVVMQGRRRQWELTLAGGPVLTLRTTLDSDELQGGWSALDEAVAFLTRTRTPSATRDQPAPTDPANEPTHPRPEEPTPASGQPFPAGSGQPFPAGSGQPFPAGHQPSARDMDAAAPPAPAPFTAPPSPAASVVSPASAASVSSPASAAFTASPASGASVAPPGAAAPATSARPAAPSASAAPAGSGAAPTPFGSPVPFPASVSFASPPGTGYSENAAAPISGGTAPTTAAPPRAADCGAQSFDFPTSGTPSPAPTSGAS